MEDYEVKPERSDVSGAKSPPFPAWMKLSGIAVASALAGGLAAAWYYRKTLEDLRQAEGAAEIPDFGISTNHVDEDT